MAPNRESWKPSRRTLLIAAVAAAVVAVGIVLFLLGRTTVAEGQVVLVPGGDGGVARILGPGSHWLAPWSGEPLPVPRTQVEMAADVELTTDDGTRLALGLFADLGLEAGGEGEWVASAAGWQPFLDGVAAVAREALAAEVAAVDPVDVFDAGHRARWAEMAARALEEAGLAVSGLVLTAPPEANPAAVSMVRNRVSRLAEPTGAKVLVVGWDGADWLMIRPLLEQGRLPNLARLIEGGVSGELRSELPLLSPLIWTTIATGKSVEEHGIADFLVQDAETGDMVPISSNSRRVHALWTMLGAFDMTSDVVAWWATWPAEQIEGVMVTDRVAYQLFDYGGSDDPRAKVHPPRVWPRVEDHLVPAEEVGWEEMNRFVDVTPEELDERWQSLPPDRRQEDVVNHLRKIVATTKSYHAIGLDLLRRQADLTLLYYEGTDTVGHLFARYLPPRMPGVSEEDVERFGGALPAFYEWADELLGELLDAVDDDTLVLLISDHGFFTGEARPESDPSDFAGGAPQWHRLYGVIVGDGPGVEAAEVIGASIFDVAPTVLAALGLPVPEDMSGRVLTPLLPPPARSSVDDLRGKLASYEVLPRVLPQARMASQEDEDRLRELVALGYVSATSLEDGGGGGTRSATSATAAGRPPARDRAAAGAGGGPAVVTEGGQNLQGIATEAYNLGRIAQREGRLDDAERQYRTSVERMPDFAPGYTLLAQVAALRGDHSAAFDRLVEGFARSRDMPQAAITGLVDEAKESGRLDDAERVLRRLGPPYTQRSAYHAALGLAAETRGNLGTALEHYERALAIDPLDNLSVEQKITILRRLGREEEAKRFLTASFDDAEGSVSAMNQLAVSALRQRWPDVAEGLLRKVLKSDPGNPGVLANLAASLAQQGRMQEASATMQRAVERDPGNAGNYYNLGAMLAEQGRLTEALEAFETAVEKGLRSPRVHVAAAKMHFRLGNRTAARRELETAVEIEPNDPESNRLLTALREAPGG